MFGERGKDARHGGVQLGDGKLMQACVDAMRLDAGNRGEQRADRALRSGSRARSANSTMCSPPMEAMSCCGRAEGDDLAVVHDGDAIAEALGLVHVVRGENDGAAAPLEVVDQVPQMAARLGIEAGGGLVEKEQLGIADQGAGHGQALLLAAGEPADAGVALFFELRGADGFFDRDAAAEEAAKEAQRLFDGELVRELRLLELDADALAELVGAGCPVQAEQTSTVPASGAVRPSQISMVVVFPAPLGPSRPKHSPDELRGRCRPRPARRQRPCEARSARGRDHSMHLLAMETGPGSGEST